MKEEGAIKRCPTGIVGFDSACEGGFVSDSVNLVVGNAGSGKTTFLLQFLYNGAKKFNEPGLYVSFEPSIKDIYRAASKQGMDFTPLEKNGKCIFLKFESSSFGKDAQRKLASLVKKYSIKRVCFDPINVFAMGISEGRHIRKEIYEMVDMLKQIGVCVIIAGEADEENGSDQQIADEIVCSKYLADGVVELYSSGLGGSGDRAIRISKMRMTKHSRGPMGMKIDDTGIHLLK